MYRLYKPVAQKIASPPSCDRLSPGAPKSRIYFVHAYENPIPDILRWATVLPIAFISGPGTPEQKKRLGGHSQTINHAK